MLRKSKQRNKIKKALDIISSLLIVFVILLGIFYLFIAGLSSFAKQLKCITKNKERIVFIIIEQKDSNKIQVKELEKDIIETESIYNTRKKETNEKIQEIEANFKKFLEEQEQKL